MLRRTVYAAVPQKTLPAAADHPARAVELIIAAQKGEERPAELTVISADLVERGSVAPPPASASATRGRRGVGVRRLRGAVGALRLMEQV